MGAIRPGLLHSPGLGWRRAQLPQVGQCGERSLSPACAPQGALLEKPSLARKTLEDQQRKEAGASRTPPRKNPNTNALLCAPWYFGLTSSPHCPGIRPLTSENFLFSGLLGTGG